MNETFLWMNSRFLLLLISFDFFFSFVPFPCRTGSFYLNIKYMLLKSRGDALFFFPASRRKNLLHVMDLAFNIVLRIFPRPFFFFFYFWFTLKKKKKIKIGTLGINIYPYIFFQPLFMRYVITSREVCCFLDVERIQNATFLSLSSQALCVL